MGLLTERAWAEAAARDRVLSREAKKTRGIVHTPPALARFVARTALGLADALGLAGPRTLIDAAIGTGMFPAAILEVAPGAVERVVGHDVDEGALERAHAVLAPGAVLLELRHGSALEHPPEGTGVPIVVGNPPWAGKSASRGSAASDTLLDDFRRDDGGVPLRERKIGVLSDDYVRFVRWSVEVLRRSPSGGVLGLVTNGSWLDGPVHRGMRAALVRWLDEIVIVDLGGSALVARSAGVRDENVFSVRPSVSILLAGRRAGTSHGARVRHVQLRGSRDEKLAALDGATLATLDLTTIGPRPPSFLFVPRSEAPARYTLAPALDAWMPFHREGLQTNRDDFAIDEDRARLLARLAAFVDGSLDAGSVPGRSAHFDPDAARVALAAAAKARGLDTLVAPCAYRPFDDRLHVTDASVCHRPRPELARAVARSRFVLVTTQKDRGTLPFRHLAVVRAVPDSSFLSARSSARSRAFPTHDEHGAPNVGPSIILALEALGVVPEPTTVAAYLAAHLGAPSYQHTFDVALRAEMPRVPLPTSNEELETIAAAGRRLVDAWLERPAPRDAPDHEAIDALVVGHIRVLPSLRRRGLETPAARDRAAALLRAEAACDAAISASLARMR